MKIARYMILPLLFSNTLLAQSYKDIISQYARPTSTTQMRDIRSEYLPAIERCFNLALSDYNVTNRSRNKQFEVSIQCYQEENSKLPTNKRVNFDECKNMAARKQAYDLAYCYQELFVAAHNYHGY